MTTAMNTPARPLDTVAEVAAAFSVFSVAVILCICAAMPPPDWGWSVTTPFGMPLAENMLRTAFGVIAACGAATVLSARRPLYIFFFVPPLLLASLPYQTITLETALLRNPIAFEREWDSNRMVPTEDDVAAVSSDAERRGRLLDRPGGAWETIGSLTVLDFLVGKDALESEKRDWSDGERQAASDVLALAPISIPDINPAVERAAAAQSSLDAKKQTKGEWIENCTKFRRPVDGPCSGWYDAPDISVETSALTAAVAEEAKVKTEAETAKGNEAKRLDNVKAALSGVAALAATFEEAGKAANNWFWTIFISISTLGLIVILGAAHYRAALRGAGAVALTTGGIAALSFFGGFPFSGPILPLTALLSILMSIAVLLVAAISGAIIGRLMEENLPLLQTLPKDQRGMVLVESALKWTPLMACIVAGSLIAAWIVNASYGYAYNIPAPVRASAECGSDQNRLIFEVASPARDLEIDIDHSLGCHFSGALRAAREANSQSSEKSIAAAGSAGDMALVAVDRIIPTSLPCDADGHNIPESGGRCVSDAFDYDECNRFDFICKAKRIPHRAAERTYANARSDAIGWVAGKVQAIKDKVAADAPIAQAQVDALAVDAFQQISVEVRMGLWQAFRIWDAAHAAAFIIFVIAACKSLGYVFARVYYSHVPGENLKSEPQTVPKITVSAAQSHQVRTPGTYYLKLGAEPGEVAPKGPWFPQPNRMFFSRLPFRSLFNFFTLKDGRHVPLSEKGQGRFIEVEIGPSQQVAFYPSFLYAWSDTVRFSTRWSFRLPNLVRGRISTCTAAGPGRIIFFSEGEVKSIDAKYVGEGYPPTRLIAWTSDIEIAASSDASISSIYFSGVLVRPQGDSFAVFDVGSRTPFPGAVRFIPLLLSPF